MKPLIAFLPYELRKTKRMGNIPFSEVDFPLGRDSATEGYLADLGPDDHLFVYTSSRTFFGRFPDLRCKVSLLLVEPKSVHGRYYRLIRWMYWRFHRVVTSSPELIGRIPNALPFVTTNAWVQPCDAPEKTELVSLIASKRNDLEGHRLRHEIARWSIANTYPLHLRGRAYQSLADKSHGLVPYRFSVVIENTREIGYVSEKLTDCLLTKTVPIYWGSPTVGDVFDKGGLIECTNAHEIEIALQGLTVAQYDAMRPAIERNFKIACAHADMGKAVARQLLAHEP